MSRPVFIIIGSILVFVLLGVWVYVLFFGSPSNKNPDTFANFNIGDTTDTSVVIEEEPMEDKPVVDRADTRRLRQLTTEPVVGYQEVLFTASSTPEILYIRAGTGHIYSIDDVSGEERQVSKTTFKSSVDGAITPNGKYMMVRSGSGMSGKIYVGEIDLNSTSVNSHEITENIVDFKATSDNTFLYAIKTNTSLIGVHYYPISDLSETIFTVPFREAAISWGDTAKDVHYVYPKASNKLEGFVYQIANGQLNRLPIDGYGLSASGNDSSVIYSEQEEESYKTFVYDTESKTATELPFDFVPEKCTSLGSTGSRLVCASEALTDYGYDFPDVWYRGDTSFVDVLREIDIVGLNPNIDLLVDIKAESGREVDVVGLISNQDNSDLYFTNKNDQTLWQYVLLLPVNEEVITGGGSMDQ